MATQASAFQLDLESETPQAAPSQDAGSRKRLWFFQGMGLAGLMLMGVAGWTDWLIPVPWPTSGHRPLRSGRDAAVAFLPSGFAVPTARSSGIVKAGSGFYEPTRAGGVATVSAPQGQNFEDHMNKPGAVKASSVPRWTKPSNGGFYDPTRAGGVATAPAPVPTITISEDIACPVEEDLKACIQVAMETSRTQGGSQDQNFEDYMNKGGAVKASTLPRWQKPNNGGFYEPTRAGGVATAPAPVPSESGSQGQNFEDYMNKGGAVKASTLPRWQKPNNGGFYEPSRAGGVATAPAPVVATAPAVVATAPAPVPTESGSQGQNFEDYMNKGGAAKASTLPRWQKPSNGGFYDPTRAGGVAAAPQWTPMSAQGNSPGAR